MKRIVCLIALIVLMACPLWAADVKISELPVVTETTPATDVVPVNASGVTSQITVANLLAGKQASNANLTALAGLTFADVSLIQLTGAGAAAVLTCTANQLIGANSAGDALECKSSIPFSSIALSGDLTGLMPSVIVLVPSGVATAAHEYILTHADDSSAANAYVGMTLYNVTTPDSCTVTASTNTTITCAATATMGWDDDPAQSYQLGPGPTQSGSMFYVAGAGTLRWPATVGYGACMVADGTNKLTIDMASDSMIFTGTLDADVVTLDAGDCIDSSDTTTDDFICLHNKSATAVKGMGKRGTWADGGAS